MIEPDHTEPANQWPPPDEPVVDTPRWGIGDALASYGIFILVSTMLGLTALRVGDGDRFAGAWLPIVVTVPPLIQVVHLGWVARSKGRGLVSDFGLSFDRRDPAVAAGLWIAAMAGATVAASIIVRVIGESPNAAVAELAENSENGGGITIWILLLVVAAITVIPLTEELLYRGLWWSALAKRGVDERWILVITSLIFAAVHLEPSRTPVLFAIGLAIGWGRLRTGRIGAGIIAHSMINTLGMIALLARI